MPNECLPKDVPVCRQGFRSSSRHGCAPKDGRYRWFLFRYKPVLDEEGRIVRWFATGTDIEDRKHAEDRMRNETVALREDIVRSSMFERIVGSSPALKRVLAEVEKVASTDSTVLILGETGTGKELIATCDSRSIEAREPRVRQRELRGDSGISHRIGALRA